MLTGHSSQVGSNAGRHMHGKNKEKTRKEKEIEERRERSIALYIKLILIIQYTDGNKEGCDMNII